MTPTLFHKVWYLPAANTWSQLNLLAMKDTGVLVLEGDSVEFRGRKYVIRIANIRQVSCAKQGRDFINEWVRVEFGTGQLAYFADGSWLGWSGLLGGTTKIYKALANLKSA